MEVIYCSPRLTNKNGLQIILKQKKRSQKTGNRTDKYIPSRQLPDGIIFRFCQARYHKNRPVHFLRDPVILHGLPDFNRFEHTFVYSIVYRIAVSVGRQKKRLRAGFFKDFFYNPNGFTKITKDSESLLDVDNYAYGYDEDGETASIWVEVGTLIDSDDGGFYVISVLTFGHYIHDELVEDIFADVRFQHIFCRLESSYVVQQVLVFFLLCILKRSQ